jgi:SAM-dependent methyltransferase
MSETFVVRTEKAARSPADVYDEQFVPALFGHWGPVLRDAADVAAGQQVLDVACGTGALTVAVAGRVWHEGRAESLPFNDATFDAVVSQFGLMFFDDRIAALREMWRVLRPGGRLAVAVCDAIEHSPGYASLAALLDRLFGKHIGDAFRAPFVRGDAHVLRALCTGAGIADARIVQRQGSARFASIDALVSTERACAWTLGGALDDRQFEQLRREAQAKFAPFVDPSGMVAFEMPALLITAART